MVRRSRQGDPEKIRTDLLHLLLNFEKELKDNDLRQKVKALIPAFHLLRDLGCSLIPAEERDDAMSAAKGRILAYFRKYPREVLHGDELMVVSGIQDWPRRIRELRKEFGWAIGTGYTLREMAEVGELDDSASAYEGMRPEEYVLLDSQQDREAALRWSVANEIRRGSGAVRDKILKFLRHNVGHPVTGEELRYVAKDRTEWARRVRELRTEYGWPIVTRNTGRPDLPVGVYVLEQDRQSPVHDRGIPDPVRRAVLVRDGYRCTKCGWSHEQWNRSDPRHLELHHVRHHVHGGANTEDNLIAVCTVCHDEIHR